MIDVNLKLVYEESTWKLTNVLHIDSGIELTSTEIISLKEELEKYLNHPRILNTNTKHIPITNLSNLIKRHKMIDNVVINSGPKRFASVYLLKDKDNNYKIGFARSIKQRLLAFKTLPNKIQLVHCFKSSDAKSDESILHNLFHNRRVIGEWFRLNEHEVTWICNIKSTEQLRTSLIEL